MGQFTIVSVVPAIFSGIVFGISVGYLSAKKELRQIEEGKMKQLSTVTLLLIIGTIIVGSVCLTILAPSWYRLPKEAWSSLLLFLVPFALSTKEMRIYLFNNWERIHQREILVDETGFSRKVYATPPPTLQQDA